MIVQSHDNFGDSSLSVLLHSICINISDRTNNFLNQITSYQQLLSKLNILWKACPGHCQYID